VNEHLAIIDKHRDLGMIERKEYEVHKRWLTLTKEELQRRMTQQIKG
jgi:hypothetical protein